MTHPACDECRAILAELREAYRAIAGEMRESRLAGDKEFAQAWRQARRLRTEEDVVLAEEVFPKMKFNSSPRVGLALGRKLLHEARTGHKIDLRPHSES